MKLSKICTVTAFVIGLPLTFAPTESQAISLDSMVSKILSTVTDKIDVKNTLCKKGNAKKLIFSLRSFSGKAGNVPLLGPFGVSFCKGETGFHGSGFDKKARAKMGKDKTSKEAILETLDGIEGDFKGQTKKAAQLICKIKKIAPEDIPADIEEEVIQICDKL